MMASMPTACLIFASKHQPRTEGLHIFSQIVTTALSIELYTHARLGNFLAWYGVQLIMGRRRRRKEMLAVGFRWHR